MCNWMIHIASYSVITTIVSSRSMTDLLLVTCELLVINYDVLLTLS